MKATLGIMVLLATMSFAINELAYFTGTVTWSGGNVDHAVVALYESGSSTPYVTEDIYTSGDDYLFDGSVDWARDHDPFRLDCWLVHDDHTVSVPQSETGIDYPADFGDDPAETHTKNFTW